MTRVAAIDCGTNSLRLLVADSDPATGALTDVMRDMQVVGLGQGVDRTGEFAADALARALAVTADYATVCREAGVERVRFVATSASRDARNSHLLVDGVRDLLGVAPEIISGEEEANLSFRGALSVLDSSHARPVLVVDLGGGSTELVLGVTAPDYASSMDVGCIRMTERHLEGDPPTGASIASAQADIHAAIDRAFEAIPARDTGTVVGVAGSVTTVTALALGLQRYDPDVIHGARLSAEQVDAACAELLAATRPQRAAMPFMHPGRVESIAAGALVWRTVLSRVRAEVKTAGRELGPIVTSEHDILDGVALSLSEWH